MQEKIINAKMKEKAAKEAKMEVKLSELKLFELNEIQRRHLEKAKKMAIASHLLG